MSKDRATRIVHRETITSTTELNRDLALRLALKFAEQAPVESATPMSTLAVALIHVSAPSERIDYTVTVREDGQAFADKKRGTRGNTRFKDETVRKGFTTEMQMAIQSLPGARVQEILPTRHLETTPSTRLESTPITLEQSLGASEATLAFKLMIALHNEPITRDVELSKWANVIRQLGLPTVFKALEYLLTDDELTRLNEYLYQHTTPSEMEIVTYLAQESNTNESSWNAIYKYFHHQVYQEQYLKAEAMESLL